MQAYQIMPDREMFTLREVTLTVPIAEIVSRPGMRVNCDACGEEIMNEREIKRGALALCRACAQGAYYQGYVSSNQTLFSSNKIALHSLASEG
jgi:formylmethanofuran dehydrogenase subunit E